jgi:hypothetical protein
MLRDSEKHKKPPDMKIIMEAWNLELYSLAITSNSRRFPKKYRFSLCNKIQNTALEIAAYLLEANEIDLRVKERRGERIEFQNRAMRKCKLILHYIELSRRLNIINADAFEHWVRMANNVKNMCGKWQQSDLTRAGRIEAQKGDAL